MQLDRDFIISICTYDPESGDMFWKERPRSHFKTDSAMRSWNTKHAGKPMRTLDGKGYRVVGIFGKRHIVHRLIWLYIHGEYPNVIDHINGDRTDNRLCNLRNVDSSENHKNMSMSRKNTSGVTGVYLNKKKGLWCAQIKHNGVTRHIGSSPVFEDAVLMRKAEEKRLGFSRRHGEKLHAR